MCVLYCCFYLFICSRAFCVHNCVILPLCAEGCLAGPPSFLWDQSDHHRSVTFFIQIMQRIAFRIGGFIHWLHSFKIRLFFGLIGLAILYINPFECGLLLISCCFLIFPSKFHSPDTVVGLICVFLNTYFCSRSLLFCLIVLVLVILVACFWICCLLRI